MVQELGEATVASGSADDPPLPSERGFGGASSSQASQNVLNLSDSGLRKITLPSSAYTSGLKKLILDRNQIIKAENLSELSETLEQLSIASNRLVRLIGFTSLRNLKVLNLPHNSIAVIEGLKEMTHLVWLNLSNNNIKSLDGIGANVSLTYLDVSHNNLTSLSVELKNLSALKTLMLHGNLICSLSTFPDALPIGLNTMSLAENEVTDLCQFSFLSCLPKLQQLSVQKNPCIEFCVNVLDYRSYILNWCLNLHMLDSSPVTNRESLKAEWLYTQGKGRKFKPGEMNSLTSYLKTHCPIPGAGQQSEAETSLQSDEDVRLSKVLNKQLQYQKQMQRRRTDHNRESNRGDESVLDQDRTGPAGDCPLNSTVFDSVSDLGSVLYGGPSGSNHPYAVNNVRNDESLPRKNGFFQAAKSSGSQAVTGINAQNDGQAIAHGSRPDSLNISVEDTFEDDSLALVSESFLLPVDSPPNPPNHSQHVSGPEDSLLINGANTNLDEVSFSEMLPGVDRLPEVAKEASHANPLSANQSSFQVTDYVTPAPKPSSFQPAVKSKKDRQVFNRAVNSNAHPRSSNSETLEAYHCLAIVIQATWRGYIFRKKHSDLILCLKRMTQMQKQINSLTDSVSSNRLFQSKMLDLVHQLVVARSIPEISVARPVSSQPKEAEHSLSPMRKQDGKDTLSILENEFSRMSNQFGNPSGVGFSGNDTSTSSLRVMSLTDEELSMDSEDENQNLQNETFTETSVVQKSENLPNVESAHPKSANICSPTSVKPPSQVKVKTKGSGTLLISWKASSEVAAGSSVQEHSISVLSYKIVLNNVSRGIVSGSKTHASVEGLDLNTQKYVVTVRTVTALGESVDSYPPVSVGPLKPNGSDQPASHETPERAKYTLLHLTTSSHTSPVKNLSPQLSKTGSNGELNLAVNQNQFSVPEFRTLLRDVNLHIGETAVFNATIHNPNAAKVQVTWFLADKNVNEIRSDRVTIHNDLENHSMEIKNCMLTDRGTVTCVAENEAGSTRSICNLDVQPCDDDAANVDEILETSENIENEPPVTSSPLAMPSNYCSMSSFAHRQSEDLWTSDQILSPNLSEPGNCEDKPKRRPIRRSEVSPREPLTCQPAQYTSLANLVADEPIDSDHSSRNDDVFSSEHARKTTFSRDENDNLEPLQSEEKEALEHEVMQESPLVNRLNETYMVCSKFANNDDMSPCLKPEMTASQSLKASQVISLVPPPHRSLSPIRTSSIKGPSKPVVPSTSGMSDACIPENDDDTNCSDTFVTQSSRSRLVNLKDVTQSISITNSYTNSGTSPNCEDLNSEANTSASLESVKIAVSVHENFPVTINNDSLPRADARNSGASTKKNDVPNVESKLLSSGIPSSEVLNTTTSVSSVQNSPTSATPDMPKKLSCSLFQVNSSDAPVRPFMVEVNGIRKLRPLKPRVMKRNSYFSKLCREYPY